MFRVTKDTGDVHGASEGHQDLLALAVRSETRQAFAGFLESEKIKTILGNISEDMLIQWGSE